MKKLRFWAGAALVLGLGSPALADRHDWHHMMDSFVADWNGHNTADMENLWTADAKATDVLGRDANGRAEVARLFSEGGSGFRLTDISLQQSGAGVTVVEFEGEITGWHTASGTLLPPSVRRFTAVLKWGPDLPGGHHPRGRFFIASIRPGASSR